MYLMVIANNKNYTKKHSSLIITLLESYATSGYWKKEVLRKITYILTPLKAIFKEQNFKKFDLSTIALKKKIFKRY